MYIVKVDNNTVDLQRGKFVRICVEIDLDQPVIGMVGLRGVWYNVEYEGLHLICSNCGCYGHMARNCSSTKETMVNPSSVVSTTLVSMEAVTKPPQPQGPGMIVGDGGEKTGVTSEIVDSNDGGVIAANPEPLIAHGEWLVVDKRRRNQGKIKPNHEHLMSGPGRKGKELMTCAQIPKQQTPLMTFVADPNDGQRNHKAIIANGKKRIRRDPLIIADASRIDAGCGGSKKTASYLLVTETLLSGKGNRNLGNTMIYQLADGTKTTTPMKHVQGNR